MSEIIAGEDPNSKVETCKADTDDDVIAGGKKTLTIINLNYVWDETNTQWVRMTQSDVVGCLALYLGAFMDVSDFRNSTTTATSLIDNDTGTGYDPATPHNYDFEFDDLYQFKEWRVHGGNNAGTGYPTFRLYYWKQEDEAWEEWSSITNLPQWAWEGWNTETTVVSRKLRYRALTEDDGGWHRVQEIEVRYE